jgi:hypothetical protein
LLKHPAHGLNICVSAHAQRTSLACNLRKSLCFSALLPNKDSRLFLQFCSLRSYEASRGIRIAGQTFDGSTDGTIKGSFKSETVRRQSDGTFEVVVPPVSAAILEFDA